MNNSLLWGCIADDFTGASDVASFFVEGGLKTLLFNGLPSSVPASDCQAVVIALKTRTQETGSAIKDSLSAARWLKMQGAKQLYMKYCSTFDSTPKGNIGPILDALLEEYQLPYTILCPALPVNGRQVIQGRLYVNGIPLDQSPMGQHPLTPMWDSRISVLMEAQSKYPTIHIDRSLYSLPVHQTADKIRTFGAEHPRFYVIPDYEKEEDAAAIADRFGHLPLLSGGSGLVAELARRQSFRETEPSQPALILAGSCSDMTRRQIVCAQSHHIPSLKIVPQKLLEGSQTQEELWHFIQAHQGQEVLVYSSDSPENVHAVQKSGKERMAQLLEQTMAQLARQAVAAGYTRIIVAGGETSGAVTKALGFDSYIIGESVAPGVPVMIPHNRPNIRLVLKSGNFGQEDFFLRALALTKG
ncbi:MAG: four-carbon acid sugar kinase family protein [Lachnospiraceae bacterium]|nr:four-carbon acid sugar kinase family protein [Lachnospiraceae bacterium]